MPLAFTFLLIAALQPSAAPTPSSITLGPPLLLKSGTKAWLKSAGPTPTCREAVELPGTFLCLFPNQESMNATLGRITAFAEGSLGAATKGVVPNRNDSHFISVAEGFRGHNLSLKSIHAFATAAAAACTSQPTLCLSPAEQGFVALWGKAPPHSAYMISASADKSDSLAVIAHEVLHAQYAASEEYRAVVEKFWKNTLTEADRSEIRSFLAQSYDPTDEALMRNEFQAYILMREAEKDFLGPAVRIYRLPLEKELKSMKIVPLQVR